MMREALSIIDVTFQKLDQELKKSNTATENTNDNTSAVNNATEDPQTAPPEHVHSMDDAGAQPGNSSK